MYPKTKHNNQSNTDYPILISNKSSLKPESKTTLLKKTNLSLVLVGLMLLTACGQSESINSETETKPINQVEVNTKSVTPATLDLATSFLNKPAFLGLLDQEVKGAAPCPFLSDEAATASVKTDWELKLRESSNNHCYWSKNAGFSIKLSIEPLATAKLVSERAYNMDSPPVLKPQPAPGNNATILYDTTWDKELAYAMSFEQDEKLVMIYVTGLKTDAQRLTTAAKEVASKLSNTLTETANESTTGPFDMCSTWSESQMTALVGSPLKVTPDKNMCNWETGTGANFKQIKVGIYYGKNHPWESLLEYRGSKDIPGIGERSILMKNRKKAEGWPANVTVSTLYNELLVSVSVSDSIDNNEAVVLELAKNIDSRFK